MAVTFLQLWALPCNFLQKLNQHCHQKAGSCPASSHRSSPVLVGNNQLLTSNHVSNCWQVGSPPDHDIYPQPGWWTSTC